MNDAPKASATSDTGGVGERNLERRIKKQILGRPQTALVRFPKGLGEVCAAEVARLLAAPLFGEGATSVLEDNAVKVDGISFRELTALALRLTTAREILWLIAGKRATGKTEVRELLRKVPWDLYWPAGASYTLRVSSTASRLYHESMLKEIVVGTLTEAAKASLAEDKDTAAYALDFRLVHDRLTLALGAAATPLHRRGYKRTFKGVASVKEDLAAGAVQLGLAEARAVHPDFQPALVFVPFAGSGTLGFEAAMALDDIPPAVFLPPLSLETLVCMPTATRDFIRRRLTQGSGKTAAARCAFVEIDAEQVEALAVNTAAFNAGLTAVGRAAWTFDLQAGDAHDSRLWPQVTASTAGQDILVLLNPPYGDRLQDSSLSTNETYAALGKRLEQLAAGHRIAGSVFVPTEAAAGRIEAATPSLAWTRRPISHGGKPILLSTFRGR